MQHKADQEHFDHIQSDSGLIDHTREKPFKCSICDQFFLTKYNRDRHMKTHMKEKSHKCTHCEQAFSQKKELECHKK